MYNISTAGAATAFGRPPAPSLREFSVYFLRLGAVGFGGPIALVSWMERDLVQERRWISEDDYRQGLAFAQLAPGPLAAQLAMYLGHVLYGWWGATVIGAAFISPSFAMVVGLGYLYVRYGGLLFVEAMFYGVGAAVIGIVAFACVRLSVRVIKKDRLLWGIFLVLALTTAITGKENVFLFVGAGVVTLILRGRIGWKQWRSNALFVPALLAIPGLA
jgi:chromate transporter